MDTQEIQKIVMMTVAAQFEQVNKQQSSVKITQDAKGNTKFEIKVYGDNPTSNLNYARYLMREALKEHGQTTDDSGAQIAEPTANDIGEAQPTKMPPAPKQVLDSAGEPVESDDEF